MRRHRVVGLLAGLLTLISSARANVNDFTFICAKDHQTIRLPFCPPGCEVRLFWFPTRFIGDYKHKAGWRELFAPSGMNFPKGGFVVYQPATGTCVIASTADDLDVLSAIP